jgi:hypothetical protein
MFVRPSKHLALVMALFFMGFSVAPVWALCAAPCCKADPSLKEPVQSVACHGDQAHEPPESTPSCLLEGHHPTDVAASGSNPELRVNRFLDAQWASVPVALLSTTWSVEARVPGTDPPVSYPSRPIYILSVSLLC